MRYPFFILIFFFFSTGAAAQIKVYENDSTGVIIHADPRLEVINNYFKTKAAKTYTAAGNVRSIRSARGFRVQIYNGNDRNKATQLKVDFMRKHPNVRTYMTYIQPQFRVKVGDFATRAEAQKFASQISAGYSSVMIVPDIVVINTFKND